MKRLIFNHSKKITSWLVAISILLTTIFSVTSIKGFFTSAVSPDEIWDGNAATAFAGGDGTEANPFLIENGGQLFKAINDLGKKTDGAAAYYLLTADIYLNEGYENYASWATTAPTNNWLPTNGDFIGHLDGGLHTVYGLYSVTGAWRNGLIRRINSGATVSNLAVAKSYVKNNDSVAGGIVGAMYDNTKVTGCLVYDAVISAGNQDVGGIAGVAAKNTVTISQCGTYNVTVSGNNAGGILGRAYQSVSGSNGTRLLNCFSVDNFPFGNNGNTWASECFTNVTGSKGGVSVIEKAAMQGADALTTLKLSTDIWSATESYPVIVPKSDDNQGGEDDEEIIDYPVWDGAAATEFAGGDGSKDNPYLIENGGQLYKAIAENGINNGNGLYYLITADIYLNKNYKNYTKWATTAPDNNWAGVYNNGSFAGYLDGGFHTIYGLYYRGNAARAGLIPYLSGNNAKISNLIIKNSFVHSSGDSTAIFAGRLDNGTISNCVASDSAVSNGAKSVQGGIVAYSNSTSAKIDNCGAYNLSFNGTSIVGGILGKSAKSNATVSNCFSGGTYIFGNTSNIACSNSYTDIAHAWKNGVSNWSATPGKMQGSEAVTNMNLSDTIWKATDGYPVIFEYKEPDPVPGPGEDEEVDYPVWDGTIASEFAGGDGSKENPYLIENGGQLYKAISELGKKADGTAAYYLIKNDIFLNKHYEKYETWETAAPKNNWLPTRGDFIGHLDGGAHTVYGLYSVTGSWRNGLIPYINSGSTVSSLIIANAYIRNNDSVAGGIVGAMYDNTKVNGCLVRDSIISANNQDVGGIAGVAAKNTVTISNCGTHNVKISGNYSGGILGRAYQLISGANGTRILNCFSAGNFPLGDKDKIWASGTYTDIADTKGGVIVVENSLMQGADAVKNMNLWYRVWKATDTYPTLYVYQDPNADKIWDGKVADEFAGGSGKDTDPYIIENGNQLFKAINDLGKNPDGTAAYYMIASDIYLNSGSENYSNWATYAPDNNWNPTRSDFIGHIDGDFHTIYGLYCVTGYWRNGLIPFMNSGSTVSNLTISNSYIYNKDSVAGGIVGAMYDNTRVEACLVKDSVVSATRQDVGGIAGAAAKNTVTILNCGTYNLTISGDNAGGILGRAYQIIVGANGTRVLKCFSGDNFPLGDKDKIWVSDSYTNIQGSKGGVNVLEKEKMQGEGAVSNMSLVKALWKDTEGYPILSGKKEIVGDIWSGISATRFASGSGTEYDPYIIETASQLYKAISELGKKIDGTPAYYLLTSDIILNKDYDKYSTWGNTAPENNWLPISASADFAGHLNGGGHTVYGLYVNKTAWCAGLIARVKGGSVRDLNVAKSYIHSEQGTVGGIVGMAYEGTTVSRCKVTDTVIVDKAATDLGGIVGAAKVTVLITGCASYNLKAVSEGAVGGILGRAWSSAYVRESYSIGNYPIGHKETHRMGCINVYTDKNSLTKSGVTVLSNDEMKGKDALDKMQLTTSIWQADSKDYPVFRSYGAGEKGEIWSGGIAEYYAGGDGTKENPYLIETGEQLYKLIFENCVPSNVPRYYKVTADIRLNITDGEKWYEKADVNMWHFVNYYSFSFGGHLDGAGHTVAGVYTENESGNAYAGLIPVIDMASSVKNIGVIESNISTSVSTAENFSGGIVGWIDNWDVSNPVTKENIPVVSGCFADHTVSINGMYCGGIVSGVSAPVLVENCYFTGNFDNYTTAACIIGNVWTPGSKISHCYAATSGMYTFAGGQSVLKNELEYEACYNFGKGSGANFYFVSLYDMRGNKAKKALSQLDFKNIWKTVDGGTPVLKIFGENADKFSSKNDVYSTVSFITNVAGMSVEPITGLIDSPITLPTPQREGYNFAGWYVYSELQCEYTYDTFPFIDLILYAKWEPSGVAQDFEKYPNTYYDLDDDYVYFRPGVENYDGGNVHGGNKAIKRLGNSSERQDFLVKYEKELTVGKEYTITFWMMTETDGATGKVSMLNASWPDIAEPVKGEEMTVAEYKNLPAGQWKQYRYTFTALTPWVSLRTDGNTALYFDDILIFPTK